MGWRAEQRFAIRLAIYEHRGHPGSNLSLDEAVIVALDAAQDALLRHDGRESGKVSYLAHAIKWRLKDAYRNAGRFDDREPPPRVQPDFVPDLIDRLYARAVINKLTEKQKRVIFGLYYARLNIDQTAEWLDLAPTSVVSLRHRALESMRREVGD